MAEFTVGGMFYDRPVKATWADGELTGDPDFIAMARAYVAKGWSVAVTPVGPFYLANLDEHAAAFATLLGLLSGSAPRWVEGDTPDLVEDFHPGRDY